MSIPDEKQKKGRRGSIAISTLLNDEPVEPLIKLDEVEESDHPSPMSSSAESPKQSISLIKAKRKRISPAQYNRLMEIFDQTDTPSSEIRENLANELEMTKREVQVWFQNRRAKMNRSKQTNTLRNRHRQSSLIPPTAMYSAHPIQRPRRASHSALETQRLNPGLYPIAPMPVLLRQDVPTARPPSTLAYQQQGVPVSAPPPLLHQQHVPPTAQYSLPPVPPNKYYENEAYQQRSAIDILASAAEYIRTDRKELGSSRI